ncbi:DDE-type integrase/transposase/recombinase [Polymorphum gilvum]|uniref:Integrase catalytic region n=1 Tax=Polymorphum gilvum (strain LMG 25793 / CGMCC 1.9160 / SL003B-26A1) TaxID=991905 RepID=F2J665_POLGS|nr:DDE-type integrase/transposase/recombinase [Polymorphum gilvum]ADZ72430.1 Integrase catalytic region [Polymorphum gilvum SL003B-26A1]
MTEWLTAREIAELGLPGLPGTERGVRLLAESERWHANPAYARDRVGRGGGLEYHIALLPTLARLAYETLHRRIETPAPDETAEPSAAPAPAPGTGTDRAAMERDARLAIVAAYEDYAKGQRLGQASLTQTFVARYNAGKLSVDDWIGAMVPHLSKRTLARWRAAKKQSPDLLGFDPSTARKGKAVLETANGGALRTFILALIAHQPHLSGAHVRTLCRDEFGDEIRAIKGGIETALPMPPVRTFQHFLRRLKSAEKVALTRLTNPDRYRSTMAPSGVGSLRFITEANTLWQIDASPVDAYCTDGRYSIYACTDIATRRICWYVSRTPRASAVALLIRKAILAWGVPAKIKTDNGSDFVARDTKRLFAALDIEMELSAAYTPQQKGHVERAIKTFQHDCATLLPGYVGHSVADRKAIEDRKSFADRLGADTADMFDVSLTGPQLQAYVDDWARYIYEARPHAGLSKGMTPADAAAASSAPIRTVAARALDVLLMPAAGKDGLRKVTKFGVRIDGFHYVINAAMPGDAVFVRMDPNDSGKAYAFDADDGRYIGEAVCPELAGLHPKTIIAAKKEAQAQALLEATREVKARIRDITSGRPLIERAIDVAKRDALAREDGKVVALPKRQEEHSTPEIAAALDVTAPEPVKTRLSGRAAEIAADLAQGAATRSAPVTQLRRQETPQLRFRRALALEAAIAAGEPVETADAMWLGGYQTGPEYKAMSQMYEDFGEI